MLKRLLITEGSELVALALIEFILELNPVETKGVQEALHHVHRHQDTNCERNPHEVADPDTEECTANRVSLKGRHNSVFYEDSGKLTVSKRKSPETEVRSCVGDGTQHKLDCLYQLVNNDVSRFTMTIILLRLIL